MSFDPAVEAIRGALRALDADPRSVSACFTLIHAYLECADREEEPELLEQAGFVIRDVRKLPMTESQKQELALLEARRDLLRARPGRGNPKS